jgi:uncharacterized membrane protein
VTDRRVVFFVGAAGVCAILVPAAPREFQWVPKALSVAYLVLAVLVVLDSLSRRSRGKH